MEIILWFGLGETTGIHIHAERTTRVRRHNQLTYIRICALWYVHTKCELTWGGLQSRRVETCVCVSNPSMKCRNNKELISLFFHFVRYTTHTHIIHNDILLLLCCFNSSFWIKIYELNCRWCLQRVICFVLCGGNDNGCGGNGDWRRVRIS